MNKHLFFISAAATLLATACTQDKPAAVDAATTPAADTAVVVTDGAAMTTDTATYSTDADRMARRIADDLKLTDTVVVTRIEKTYYTRGRRLGEIETSYAADTTGRYAALRKVNDDTDREVRTIVTDRNQYNTYSANRDNYYSGTPYSIETPNEGAATAARVAPARRSGPSIVKYDKKANGETKIVYSNGTTVKVDKDGDRKTEYSNGTKVKRDADDGEVKVKR